MSKNKPFTRKQHIHQIAAVLFKEKGYNATTMRDLAEKVGMEAASLYNHIKSKEEILQEICFKIAHTYLSQLDKIEQEEVSYTEKIEALIRLHIRIITEEIEAVNVANNEWKHLSEPYLSDFISIRKNYEKRFAALIQAGIEKGEFQKVLPSVALFTILSAVRWVELWYKPAREISPKELEDNILAMLMNGLKLKDEQ
jgi:AcrR family transcriptional regulator